MTEVWVAYTAPSYDPGHVIGVATDEITARILAERDCITYTPCTRAGKTTQWVAPLWDDDEPRETRVSQLDGTDYYVAPFPVEGAS